MDDFLQQAFTVGFEYRVYFTSGLFENTNGLLDDFFKKRSIKGIQQKILFVIDSGVTESHPELLTQIKEYFNSYPTIQLIELIMQIPGGETAKNNVRFYEQIVNAVNDHGLD